MDIKQMLGMKGKKTSKLKKPKATYTCIICEGVYPTKGMKYIISLQGVIKRKELTWHPCCVACKKELMKGMKK